MTVTVAVYSLLCVRAWVSLHGVSPHGLCICVCVYACVCVRLCMGEAGIDVCAKGESP